MQTLDYPSVHAELGTALHRIADLESLTSRLADALAHACNRLERCDARLLRLTGQPCGGPLGEVVRDRTLVDEACLSQLRGVTMSGGYTTRRHPRSIAEAWMRPPARQTTLQGPYRRRRHVNWTRWVYAGLVLASIAACGVLVR